MPGSSIPAKKLIDTLRKRVPKGATLPDGLDALLTAWADAEWGVLGFVNLGQADAAPFIDVKPAAQKHVLAFASVSCGDQLALWWPGADEPPRVVVIGAHGEDALVFKNLPDFQRHLVEARTGVHDLDDGTADPERRSALLAVSPGPCSGPDAGLATAFTDWLAIQRPKGRPLDPAVMETLRARIVAVVHQEAKGDAAFPRWEGPDDYRQWRLIADLASGALTWMSGGKKDFPGKDAIWPDIVRLLTLTGQTRGPATITVDAEGRLFPDARTTISPP